MEGPWLVLDTIELALVSLESLMSFFFRIKKYSLNCWFSLVINRKPFIYEKLIRTPNNLQPFWMINLIKIAAGASLYVVIDYIFYVFDNWKEYVWWWQWMVRMIWIFPFQIIGIQIFRTNAKYLVFFACFSLPSLLPGWEEKQRWCRGQRWSARG